MKRYLIAGIILGIILFGITSVFIYGNTDDFSNRGWPVPYKKTALDDPTRLCPAPNILNSSLLLMIPPSCFGDLPFNNFAFAADLFIWIATGSVSAATYKHLRKNT